jgi:hypothetical protein
MRVKSVSMQGVAHRYAQLLCLHDWKLSAEGCVAMTVVVATSMVLCADTEQALQFQKGTWQGEHQRVAS